MIRPIALVISIIFFGMTLSHSTLSLAQKHANPKLLHPKMTITQVLEKHTDTWMEIPGVTGTGEGKSDGKPCIIVFTDHKSETIRKKIPKTVCGYKVVLEVIGEVKAQ